MRIYEGSFGNNEVMHKQVRNNHKNKAGNIESSCFFMIAFPDNAIGDNAEDDADQDQREGSVVNFIDDCKRRMIGKRRIHDVFISHRSKQSAHGKTCPRTDLRAVKEKNRKSNEECDIQSEKKLQENIFAFAFDACRDGQSRIRAVSL